MKQRIIHIFTYLQPFILLGVISGFLHVWHLIIIIAIGMFCLTREEAGIVFTLILPPFVGKIAPFFLPLPGTIVCLLFTLIVLNVKIFRLLDARMWNSYKYIIILLLIFAFYYMISDMGDGNSQKTLGIFIVSILSCISFCLIIEDQQVDPSHLSLFYGLCAISYLSLAYDFFGYQFPSSILDFENFRSSSVTLARLDLPTVSYHEPALCAASASAFMFCSKRKFNYSDFYLLLTYLWIVLFAGARQGIVIIIAVALVWYWIKDNSLNIRKIIALIFFYLLFLYIIKSLEVETIQTMFDTNSSLEDNLNRNIDYPLSLIKNGKISLFGIGLGNYFNPYTGETYPHNILLEIIIEMGVLGGLAVFVLICFFCFENKVSLRKRLPNGVICFVLYLPFLFRSLVSGDLSSNIVIFVSFFILFKEENIYKS